MFKDVMFYVMCALIAALIYVAIEYRKEIEHNRVLDEILVEILDKGRVEVIESDEDDER